MSPPSNPAIPKGSLVLVTGANGYLASHVVDQLLHFGYNVRGTVRDTEKSAWIVGTFEKRHGKGRVELVAVEDMTAPGAFAASVKGTSAVIHTASVMSFSGDPNVVIPPSIAFAVNALKAALAEPSVKRFVFTSSSAAVVSNKPDEPGITLTEETWNDRAVKAAWSSPIDDPINVGRVYCASKTQAEQEVWKLYKENRATRPDLVVNTVVPNFNFGTVIDPEHQGNRSSSNLVTSLWKGGLSPLHSMVQRQYFVDVQDTGRLHVGATILPDVQDRRVFAFAERFSWDKILGILRKIDPQRSLPDDFSGGEDPNEIDPGTQARSLQILRDLGLQGWTSLEDSVANNIAHVAKAQL